MAAGCGWRKAVKGSSLIWLALPLVTRAQVQPVSPASPCAPTTITTTPAWCTGSEEEFTRCSWLPDCNTCQPLDCELGAWGDWWARGACTGICLRSRHVRKPGNWCGQACSGSLTEAKRCRPHYSKDGTSCADVKSDCLFGPWKTWSDCGANVLGQRYRARIIRLYPLGGGEACQGPTQETLACGKPPSATDCVLSAWTGWASCSRSCDGGHQTRERTVSQHASGGGTLCRGSLRQTQGCQEQICQTDKDCVFGDWGKWSICNRVGQLQRFRVRQVVQPVEGHGDPCLGPTRETKPCDLAAVTGSCNISHWGDWTGCSAACGGGQTYRSRHVQNPHDALGCRQVNVVSVEACNTHHCGVESHGDCRLDMWSKWSACSAHCGVGAMHRSRAIAAQAMQGKQGCTAVIKEVAPCQGLARNCGKTDCAWDTWQDWSSCTCTCGGGEKRRNRIIKVPNLHGGKLCEPKDKSQIARCNMAPCNEHCVNGRWGHWSHWSECSATCGFGSRSRDRTVAQMPNSCGLPNTGLNREVVKCKGIACHTLEDCAFTDWNDWSYCSPHCWGTRHRFREIANYQSGTGKPCEGSVEHVSPCNPGPDEDVPSRCQVVRQSTDCQLSFWSDWTDCTTTCGGGQLSRSRHIVTLPSPNGKACNNTLSVTMACSTKPCPVPHCRDCRFSAWTDWGSCSGCGGQKMRRRSVEQLPNFCGKRCDPRNGEETTQCQGECSPNAYCSWSEWTAFSYCPLKGCGPHSQRRQRSLTLYEHPPAHNGGTYLAEGPRSIECFGMEADHKPCQKMRPCVLQASRPCLFGDWADWDAPTCSGLCYRQRLVHQNSNGMPPCQGALADTKICPKLCNHPVDCKLNEWKPWTMCIAHHAQRYRSRRVIQYPLFGGKTCFGRHVLNETGGCEIAVVKQDCKMTGWSSWSPCEKTCGIGGWQKRRRHILAPAAGGGLPCTGETEEMQGCNEFPCPGQEGCLLNVWGDWSQCRPYTVQRYRSRKPVLTEVCTAHLEEIGPCEPVDCRLSLWTAWSACPVTCGGSHHTQSRHVLADAVRGGKPCSPVLKEVKPCGEGNCDPCTPQILQCLTSKWTGWTSCSAVCGSGYQSRERSIIQTRSADGPGCNLATNQNRTCHEQACPSKDCSWFDWSAWTPCSRTCGSGTNTRTRGIANHPGPGGKPCTPINTEEMQPCNLHACQECVPVNGEWSPWSRWGMCTSSCRGGLSWRTRTNSKEMSACGEPAKGRDREYKNCNEKLPCGGDADCKLGQWETWSDCSATCDGIARRSRRIVAMGRGRGSQCQGAVEETVSCRPAPWDHARPRECQEPGDRDCVFGDWSQGKCTVSCGGGSALVGRHIKVPARGNGVTCKGPILRTIPCGTTDCLGTEGKPCRWSDWEEWGICDRANGQRKRHRHIAQLPEDGHVCRAADSEETQGCHRPGGGPHCGWADWGAWGSCSQQCRSGVRSRKRSLSQFATPPQPPLPVVHLSSGYSTPQSTVVPMTTLAPMTTLGPTTTPLPSPRPTSRPSTTVLTTSTPYKPGGLRPGPYYIKKALAVTLNMSTSSKTIAMITPMPGNKYFTVVEVATDTKDQRVRGRLEATNESPAGWISLLNLKTGHPFAHPAPAASSQQAAMESAAMKANGQRKYLEHATLEGLHRNRMQELMVSFFCGLGSVLAILLVVRRSGMTPGSLQDFFRTWPGSSSRAGSASRDEVTELLSVER